MTTITMNDFALCTKAATPAKVILSVPHDGLWAHNLSGHFIPRQGGIVWADRHVTPIANDILTYCTEGDVAVDMMRFLMPRTYVDANRPAPHTDACARYDETAYSDERVAQYYDNYFAELSSSIKRGIAEHGHESVLVLDLHGFSRNRRYNQNTDFDVILGTDYRQTIKHGEPDRLLGTHLNEAGFTTFVPAEADTLPNGDPFAGGFISECLSETHGVNVIQVEIEKRFRERNSESFGQKLAQAIGQWLVTQY